MITPTRPRARARGRTPRYMKPLLEKIERGELDPSFVITHRVELDEVPDAYEMFKFPGVTGRAAAPEY